MILGRLGVRLSRSLMRSANRDPLEVIARWLRINDAALVASNTVEVLFDTHLLLFIHSCSLRNE